ncbi:MAG: hypothetical protein Q8P41_16715 [Pseudomonadota bacterium]|nr:hypothetical protein [Pseudomonadota bacterium]
MMLLALLACKTDQEFAEIRLDAIAVVLGDFDNVGDTLTALDIATQEYDGFIVQATYEPDDDRTVRDFGGPSVEGLFTGTDENGQLQVSAFNAVFVNSGTRGLGAFRYNNQLEPDDSLLLDTDAMDHACNFATGGGTLVVSDWAYELVEYCWPDALELFGDDTVPDAAQAGIAGDVLADVKGDKLIEALGATVNLAYDYTAWSVIESVGTGTEVLLSGNVDYQPSADQLPETLTGAPLLVRFVAGRGQVVYSTFHFSAQNPQVTQSLLLEGVEGLTEGSGDDESDEAAPAAAAKTEAGGA